MRTASIGSSASRPSRNRSGTWSAWTPTSTGEGPRLELWTGASCPSRTVAQPASTAVQLPLLLELALLLSLALLRFPLLLLRQVMADDTAGRRSKNRMVARHMTRHRTYDRTLEAALRLDATRCAEQEQGGNWHRKPLFRRVRHHFEIPRSFVTPYAGATA